MHVGLFTDLIVGFGEVVTFPKKRCKKILLLTGGLQIYRICVVFKKKCNFFLFTTGLQNCRFTESEGDTPQKNFLPPAPQSHRIWWI